MIHHNSSPYQKGMKIMIRPLKKSPRQMEWKALEKKEERFITAARHQKEPLLNRKLERFVPEKLEDTLNLAFYKAFELIFNRGTSIIEKTYRKEDMENTYKINAYAAGLKESRKTMKAFSREAGKNKVRNLAAAGAGGIGLGALGIGLPDIPLFTGMVLKSIYETAISYGFSYDTAEEQCYILKLISTALSRGDAAESGNRSLDAMGRLIRTGTPLSETALSGTPLSGTFSGQDGLAALPGGPESHDTASLCTSLMQQASHALSSELLYMKFLQGIPIAGIIGGMYDAVYLKRIADYADMKYKRRFLEKSNPDI